jgi:alpha-amylase/alpha-mannosidase (GH57 family)
MNRYIAIHAHFYQPARENPWLEAIERQESAFPYHDWNQRVTAECYAPNATSRILDDHGRIGKIVNNYARISFNFGPTLLAWMEAEEPDTYRAILEADRESLTHFSGHGSAIAQAYNHTILPLANRRDKQTQIAWGINDFERRFGRRPEGMWLPETGVDTETLEVLAEQGITFTILAPHQAGRVREVGEDAWTDVSGARVDPTRPYLATLPSGRAINLFFYDGPISRAVAFERLLTRGDDFVQRLMSGFSDERQGPQLMHIATDGETYGHHHTHGEMALAYALERLEQDPEVRLTNYGEFLERHPPTCEVEILENTSWSCVHGVERWRSDCGCNGGEAGWHQQWRAPLREALDELREGIEPEFERAASALFHDPWRARDAYVNVVSDRSAESVARFFAEQATGPLGAEKQIEALELMELQRYAMLMYTSCGWFFSDISGIETVQVIQYAARVVQLADSLFAHTYEPALLRRLEAATSNIPQQRNGRHVYETLAKPALVDLPRVGAHYAVSSLFEDHPDTRTIFGFQIQRDDLRIFEAGRTRTAVGRATVTSLITRRSVTLSFGVLYMGELSLSGGVRPFRGAREYDQLVADLADPLAHQDFAAIVRLLDKHFGVLTLSMKSLFLDEQQKIADRIWASTIREAETAYRQLYEQQRSTMLFQSEMTVPPPPIFRRTAEVALNLHLRMAADQDELSMTQIQRLVDEAVRVGVHLDATTLSFKFAQMLERRAAEWEGSPESLERLERLRDAAAMARNLPFDVPLWKAQNAWYRQKLDRLPSVLQQQMDGDAAARRWVETFEALGETLAFGGQ